MEDAVGRAVAIVGLGAILPDAPDARAFWENVKQGRYSIREVPAGRWDPELYYDPDSSVPDKTYSKLGAWVRDWEWEPMRWHLPVPPRVGDSMDEGQKWAVAGARAALQDAGHPERPLDLERTAVVIGNAMAGELHYLTALRIHFPQIARMLGESQAFAALSLQQRESISRELGERMAAELPEVTEDTMPGELANCMAGRVANLFDLHGPNYVCDAACAAALAAIDSAVDGLVQEQFDSAIVGGVDRNMGPEPFVKFSKIGALSATGTRPYAEGADGFVMGEGAVFFVLKRLADAERAGDHVYAVLRGIAGASDGRGKGITAPNPAGQRLAIERAWRRAGVPKHSLGLLEGHGTSTRVGDVVEADALAQVFRDCGLPVGSVPLGSVKSNIGHLKGAAGAAGLLKTVFALDEKLLPPSLNCEHPNPNIDFAHSPFFVNRELKPWDAPPDGVRRAGVSAFGFGGTNFHAVLEEHVPGRLTRAGASVSVPESIAGGSAPEPLAAPLRGAAVLGAASCADLRARLETLAEAAGAGSAPPPQAPLEQDLRAPERIAIDYGDAAELETRARRALAAFDRDEPAVWRALRAQGVFRGSGPPGKLAFLFTGQGSQYANMLRGLRESEPVVADTFAQADRTMQPILGAPLSDFLFPDPEDSAAVERAEEGLRQTEITQPAVLSVDAALARLLSRYGVTPDFVMGHSLGEYGALVTAGALPFADALEAVAARGHEMAELDVPDRGKMAAVMAPLERVEQVVSAVDGTVVVANVNSNRQAVIGGATAAVEAAIEAFAAEGIDSIPIPVSHAFHTSIVAPISEPLRRVLSRLRLAPPELPVVGNVDGGFYPVGPDAVPKMIELLGAQVASPVQFVRGLETLYEAGARIFVEVGPKKALFGFAEDVLGARGDVTTLFTNHPKVGERDSFNHALCGLYAAGLGLGRVESAERSLPGSGEVGAQGAALGSAAPLARSVQAPPAAEGHYEELGRLFAEFLDRGSRILHGDQAATAVREPVVVTGASLGLPGGERVFDDAGVRSILDGEQRIDVIPARHRQAMVEKHITRLVKGDGGDPHFEKIDRPGEVIKLAARAGSFDLEEEFGVPGERVAAFDVSTRLAVAVGLEALRDAGIPLVMHYRTTRKGTKIPERWMLPDSLRDDTGVIFAAAFPGADSLVDEVTRYHRDRSRAEQLEALLSLKGRAESEAAGPVLLAELDRRIHELEEARREQPHRFDRRFLFRVLPMGHSQFAEYVGARGPNTHVNSACASTTQAFALADDWIRAGRCRRVVILAADDVTSDHLLEWVGAGFLTTGAAATDEVVEDAALPFDRRRHGMILGMGAAGFVVETPEAARERGLRPICEVIGTVTANSAFHGTRLDVEHIAGAMERLIAGAERGFGIERNALARELLFVSHETYTPARGGSASAEVTALRRVFGAAADSIVVANTKGLTGHPMGVGIEDAVAVKALETGVVPPVPNFQQQDPELGPLNLSRGGVYPIRYALRLGAGFGSQLSLTLLRWVPSPGSRRPHPDSLGYATRLAEPERWQSWLRHVTGEANPVLEVVKRTFRVADARASARRAESSAAPRPVGVPQPDAKQPDPLRAAPEPRPATEAAPPASAPASEAARDEVAERVLSIVSEQTGYPQDMLDLDLDLEADLGIDTVKQAETFAAIREAYGIERDENLKLRDYPTLERVIGFVRERRPDLAAPAAAPASPGSESAPASAEALPGGAAPASAAATDEVAERVLSIVSEQTGYPQDMLDLDLDLEADLGIDTVKQAETFAAIREAYGIERDENLKLRDYPTLERVIGFVRERRPDLAAPAAAPASPGSESAPASAEALPGGAAPASAAATDEVAERVLSIVSEQTGYPQDMLDLDLDLEADLGIDTVKQAETFAAIREAYGIERDENLKLRDYPTLEHVIGFVRERRPDLAAPEEPGSDVDAPAAGASSETSAPSSQLLAGDDEAAARVPRRSVVPVLRPPLEMCARTAVELTEGDRVALMPDHGGVARALVRRLEERGVEVLQLEPSPEGLAERLGEWRDAGPVRGLFWLPGLDAEPDLAGLELTDWRLGLQLRAKCLYEATRTLGDALGGPGSFLVVATRLGGQHGVGEPGASAPMGGAITGFAKAYKREWPDCLVKAVDFPTGRKTVEPAEALLEEVLHDPGAVEIGRRAGLRLTLALADQPLGLDPGAALVRGGISVVTGAAGGIVSAITADLAAASGGVFHLLDLVPAPDPHDPDVALLRSDPDELRRQLAERLRARGERATPVLVSRELGAVERADSALASMDAIRAAGGEAFWHEVDLTDGGSVSKLMQELCERHGRVDLLIHAAGIERSHGLLDKQPAEFDLVFDVKADGWFNLMRSLQEVPLGAVVVFSSIAGRFGNAGQTDYSAANDLLCKCISSLARTRPDTRAVAIDWTAWGGLGMATRGSIPQLMQRAGIDMLPAEAGIPIVRRELAAGAPDREVVVAGELGVLLEEWAERGGLAPEARPEQRGSLLASAELECRLQSGLHVRTRLEPALQPFLHHHRIDGTPVLPGVMGLEGFAELAGLLLPGWSVTAFEEVAFLAPFKFYRDAARDLDLSVRLVPAGEGLRGDCRLLGRRQLPGREELQETLHFRAGVLLSEGAAPELRAPVPVAPAAGLLRAEDVYRVYFHGPAYQVLAAAWRDSDQVVGRFAEPLPADCEPPDEQAWVAAPRLVELCFQTAGVFEIGSTGRLGLPRAIERLELFPAAASPKGTVHAVVTPRESGAGFDAVVVDAEGRVCLRLTGYETVSLPDPLDAELAAPLRAVFG